MPLLRVLQTSVMGIVQGLGMFTHTAVDAQRKPQLQRAELTHSRDGIRRCNVLRTAVKLGKGPPLLPLPDRVVSSESGSLGHLDNSTGARSETQAYVDRGFMSRHLRNRGAATKRPIWIYGHGPVRSDLSRFNSGVCVELRHVLRFKKNGI